MIFPYIKAWEYHRVIGGTKTEYKRGKNLSGCILDELTRPVEIFLTRFSFFFWPFK
jgi:hypothetical protein